MLQATSQLMYTGKIIIVKNEHVRCGWDETRMYQPAHTPTSILQLLDHSLPRVAWVARYQASLRILFPQHHHSGGCHRGICIVGEPLKQKLEKQESQLEQFTESTELFVLKEVGSEHLSNVEMPQVFLKMAGRLTNITIKCFQVLVSQIFETRVKCSR